MTRLYVLYTGGTIGSAGNPLRPMDGTAFGALLGSLPAFAGGALAGTDIVWHLTCLDTPLDSANMRPADWLAIARNVHAVREQYDGFVILHGTDTLAWTAAALSYLFAGLSKPIVLTGSQRPLAAPASDAPANLSQALLGAAGAEAGVYVAFGGALLPGSRVIKIDAAADRAFAAFGPAPATGRAPWPGDELVARASAGLAGADVACLGLYPGVSVDTLSAILAPNLRGLVLLTYGVGNGPSDAAFLGALRAAHARGVVMVAVTQALSGGVRLGEYATGAGLSGAGVISGGIMTPMAAYAKLVLLRALGGTQGEVEAAMRQDVCGEGAAGG
ncbi:MAG: asparaginase [Rhodocyclaceae bacterium]